MKTGKLSKLTSNQYYGGLNRRFDKRVAMLHKFGFLVTTNEFGRFYYRPRLWKMGNEYIAATFIHSSNNFLWNSLLGSILKRSYCISG